MMQFIVTLLCVKGSLSSGVCSALIEYLIALSALRPVSSPCSIHRVSCYLSCQYSKWCNSTTPSQSGDDGMWLHHWCSRKLKKLYMATCYAYINAKIMNRSDIAFELHLDKCSVVEISICSGVAFVYMLVPFMVSISNTLHVHQNLILHSQQLDSSTYTPK